jgi:hypothetical protein
MKTYLLLGAACAALIAGPVLAQDRTTTTTVEHADGSVSTTTKDVKKDNTGTVGGAAGGAIAGAVVAGPIGALVGGIAGATVGHTVAPPTEVRTYVTTQEVSPVAYQGQIEIGKRVDGTVAWLEVPSYPKYHWARLNDERVVVDDNHSVVAIYTN